MTLILETSEKAQVAEQTYSGPPRSKMEIQIRRATETWLRAAYPEARLVHELTMGQGRARCDIAAVEPGRLINVEIKSGYDSLERAIHQIGMFHLCGHVTWFVVAQRWADEAEILRYLFPRVGIAIAVPQGAPPEESWRDNPCDYVIETVHAPEPWAPCLELMVPLLWAAELQNECNRHRILPSKYTCGPMAKALMKHLSRAETEESVCRQLRSREALWRADPAVASRTVASESAAAAPTPDNASSRG